MLAYGVSGDFMDEYLRIAENTATKCLRKFVKSIISIYSDKYLRSPNSNDITRLLEVNTMVSILVVGVTSPLLKIWQKEIIEKEHVDFQGCWGVSIACIGNGRIVQKHGQVCFLVIFITNNNFGSCSII